MHGCPENSMPKARYDSMVEVVLLASLGLHLRGMDTTTIPSSRVGSRQ